MRGIERRIEAGLDPDVASVASLFISRWDVAVADEVPDELRNRLGIAVGKQRLRAPTASCSTPSAGSGWPNEGARPQRLLWASTGTKDPDASDMLYIEALRRAATRSTRCPRTRCTPSPTTARSATRCPPDGGDAERDAGGVRRRRDRHRRARRAAPGGGRRGVRQVLGGDAGVDRVQSEAQAA